MMVGNNESRQREWFFRVLRHFPSNKCISSCLTVKKLVLNCLRLGLVVVKSFWRGFRVKLLYM